MALPVFMVSYETDSKGEKFNYKNSCTGEKISLLKNKGITTV